MNCIAQPGGSLKHKGIIKQREGKYPSRPGCGYALSWMRRDTSVSNLLSKVSHAVKHDKHKNWKIMIIFPQRRFYNHLGDTPLGVFVEFPERIN